MTKKEYLKYLKTANEYLKYNSNFEIYFGTNESILFQNISDFTAKSFYYIHYLDHLSVLNDYFALFVESSFFERICNRIEFDYVIE